MTGTCGKSKVQEAVLENSIWQCAFNNCSFGPLTPPVDSGAHRRALIYNFIYKSGDSSRKMTPFSSKVRNFFAALPPAAISPDKCPMFL